MAQLETCNEVYQKLPLHLQSINNWDWPMQIWQHPRQWRTCCSSRSAQTIDNELLWGSNLRFFIFACGQHIIFVCSKLTMMEMESWAWKSTPTCSKNSRFPSPRWWSWGMMIIVVIVMIIMSIMFISAFFLIDGVGHVNYVNYGTGSIWPTWWKMNKAVGKNCQPKIEGYKRRPKVIYTAIKKSQLQAWTLVIGIILTNFPTYFMKHWKH